MTSRRELEDMMNVDKGSPITISDLQVNGSDESSSVNSEELAELFRDAELGGCHLANRRNSQEGIAGVDKGTIVPIAGGRGTKLLATMKVLVVVVLCIAAIVMATITHRFTRKYEQDMFDEQYENAASSLVRAFEYRVVDQVWVGLIMAIGYTRSLQQGRFPALNSTLDDFDLRAYDQYHMNKVAGITFSPILNGSSMILGWEKFAREKLGPNYDTGWPNRTVEDGIYQLNEHNQPVAPTNLSKETLASPVWQYYPNLQRPQYRFYDQFSDPVRRRALEIMLDLKYPTPTSFLRDETEEVLSTAYYDYSPRTLVYVPVFDNAKEWNVVGTVAVESNWKAYFEDVVNDDTGSMVAVVKNRCGQEMSIKVKGSSSVYMGNKDYHNTLFDGKEMQESYEARRNIWQSRLRGKELPPPEYLDLLNTIYEPPSREDALASLPGGFCSNRLSVYPTKEFRDVYLTNRPLIYTSMVVVMFVFAIAVFIAYNYVVERRQTLVSEEAKRSRAIVNSFFPAIVSDKLFGPRKIEQAVRTCRRSSIQQWCEEETGSHKFRLNLSPKIRLTALLKDRSSNSEDHPNQDDGDDPIAEMFLENIAGFTAWSSEREPRQVFKLLETLYRSFDEAAKELGVFKVETIGDCYVAVTGLPDPSADHALVMCKFAVEIRRRMEVLTQELVSSLGPGTAELGLRIGLHSGPVTAGVLRSDKARFQLFGDAMNTASRMESTGDKNRIQVSQETADLIIEFGKAKWLTPREDEVDVKGKGTMRTYWLKVPKQRSCHNLKSNEDSLEEETSISQRRFSSIQNASEWPDLSLHGESSSDRIMPSSYERLVDWNTDTLMSVIVEIIANNTRDMTKSRNNVEIFDFDESGIPQIVEVIPLPSFNPKRMLNSRQPPLDVSSLDSRIREQVRQYVSTIAHMYRPNEFHNFEHCSHVALSASKLMKRIIEPENLDCTGIKSGGIRRQQTILAELHRSTFGISSDPLTQFCVILCALIHDVDHQGVTNAQLVLEKTDIATKYQNRSVAEQHSLHLALSILEEDQFRYLRSCIFSSEGEHSRFRQLLINMTLATDIVDRELQQLRRARFDRAFHQGDWSLEQDPDSVNRRATIVLELIIQASDVAHTMQHWHIYSRWNERLFAERYSAFCQGRAANDPSTDWYEGEIGFFDHYIIPLARSLKECGVFGVTGDEYLRYALENRDEWILKGEKLTQLLLKRSMEKWQER